LHVGAAVIDRSASLTLEGSAEPATALPSKRVS
jgi:hypothetical protein